MNEERAREIRVVITSEHFQLIVENHLLKAQEAADPAKLVSLVQKIVDDALGFPQEKWHQWDGWAKCLE